MLYAEQLILCRGGRRVVAGVSLTLAAGELVVIRGPNGAGKTTLLRALAGVCPVAGGTVTRTVPFCLVGSVPAVKDTLTGHEHQTFWRHLYSSPPHATTSATWPTAAPDRRAGTLSSGQKQRLHLSRLWITDAPLWLLDEPLNALDSTAVAAFTAMLAAHLAGGGGAVVASHQDLSLVPSRTLWLTPPVAAVSGDSGQEDAWAAWS